MFNVAIERAAPADDVRIRVNNLTDCITYSVFMYTTRGLFEADKLIFTAQMAFQVSLFDASGWVAHWSDASTKILWTLITENT